MEQLVRPATVQRNLVVHLLEHHLELIDIHTIGTHGTFLSLKRSLPFAKTEQCVFVQAARTLVEGSRTETRCSIKHVSCLYYRAANERREVSFLLAV